MAGARAPCATASARTGAGRGCAIPRSGVAAMMPGQMMPMLIAASAAALASETRIGERVAPPKTVSRCGSRSPTLPKQEDDENAPALLPHGTTTCLIFQS